MKPFHSPNAIRPRRLLTSLAALALLGTTGVRAETTVEVVNYFNVQGQLEGLNAAAKDFEAATPDVKVKFTYVPFGELVSRTLQMAAVKRPPAIAAIDNPDVLRVAKAGVLKDLSGELGNSETWKDTYPGPKASVSDGGKVYGVPIGSNSLALFYNKKMLAAGGVGEPPQTWAELNAAAQKTTKSPVYGLAFSAVNTEESTWQWEPFLWSNGGQLADLSSPKAAAALQLWVDWVQKGAASREVVNWAQGDVANQFIGGRAAMMVMGPWMLGEVKKSGIDFGVTAIPVPEAGGKPVVPLGGEVWCVLKGDPKVEAAAFKFIQFLQDPARLRKMCDTFNYISSVRSVAHDQGEANADLRPFVMQMDTARARPEEGGAQYPAISLAARTAIQKALAGQATPEAALKDAAEKVKGLEAKR